MQQYLIMEGLNSEFTISSDHLESKKGTFICLVLSEGFEYTKVIIRIRISNKERKHNGQKEQKTKDSSPRYRCNTTRVSTSMTCTFVVPGVEKYMSINTIIQSHRCGLSSITVTAFTSSMIVDQRHKKRQVELTIDY
jgi:hypothetical protein